jgi:hypothetical protein
MQSRLSSAVAHLCLVRRLNRSLVKTRHFVVLFEKISLAGCNAAPTPGSHIANQKKEFAALTEWMTSQGFKPRDTAAALVQKGDPEYLARDYQWYEGSYNGSPAFSVLIEIDHRDQLLVSTFRPGGPDYQRTVPAMHKMIEEIKTFYETRHRHA